jgi:Protein of unknown function (DUF1493)
MPSTLDRVIEIVSEHSGIRRDRLSASSSLDQDVRISGDDVTELVEALAREFGEQVWQWPWQRFAELSEPHLFTGLLFFWRLLIWPIRRRIFDPSPYERLELGHIAKAIDAGHWLEP